MLRRSNKHQADAVEMFAVRQDQMTTVCKGSDTHLVEGHEADVGIREGLGAVVDLGQDLAGVGAAEHGQLVHCPVPAVRILC